MPMTGTHRQQDTVDAILQKEKVRGDHLRVQSDQALERESQANASKLPEYDAQGRRLTVLTRYGRWLRKIFKGY